MVDDGLRRTFIHYAQVRQVLEPASKRDIKIRVWQDVAERGGAIGRLGGAVRVTPFDQYGRRIYEINSTEGLQSVVQGITEITPVYARVQGLMVRCGRSSGTCGSPPAAFPATRCTRF